MANAAKWSEPFFQSNLLILLDVWSFVADSIQLTWENVCFHSWLRVYHLGMFTWWFAIKSLWFAIKFLPSLRICRESITPVSWISCFTMKLKWKLMFDFKFNMNNSNYVSWLEQTKCVNDRDQFMLKLWLLLSCVLWCRVSSSLSIFGW